MKETRSVDARELIRSHEKEAADADPDNPDGSNLRETLRFDLVQERVFKPIRGEFDPTATWIETRRFFRTVPTYSAR
jgi:hypothetical protein